jgi:hypothetical protein
MKTKSRIASILQATNLEFTVTSMPSFDLSKLELPTCIELELPINLRLGHLVEKIVAGLFKKSSNYKLLYENTQILNHKETIGELDFIVQEHYTEQVIHLELAYKFYLFDPNISSEPLHNWIGPNRNDSLKEKLDKLKAKQFPLLYHDCTRATLNTIEIDKVSQALCLLVSLFIPFEFKEKFSPIYKKGIVGYYINFETFIDLHTVNKSYYLPVKKEWGIVPSENETWFGLENIQKSVAIHLQDKQAPLCWQVVNGIYSQFFIVWW